MPDPNPADHPDNIPQAPKRIFIGSVTDEEINLGWIWSISRVGRIPTGTNGYIIPFKKEYNSLSGLTQVLQDIKDSKIEPMFSPQPAFRVTHTSSAPYLGLMQKPIQPGKHYFAAFETINAAGSSELFGTFDPLLGFAWSISIPVEES